jgi:uncharacterized protein YjiS (DUF1127 family)
MADMIFSLSRGVTGSLDLFGSKRREARDAYAQLNRYDEHMLKDIGLSRRDVEDLRRVR